LAVPHDPKVGIRQLKKDLYNEAVLPILAKYKLKPIKPGQLTVNGTGKWEIGGPHSDMGETGRKIIVDSYGGMGKVGGGCFSGKCPTKVDRSGAYAARFLAKNIVAANLADRVEVAVAYVIGYPQPVWRGIETFGTEKTKLKTIEDFAFGLLDLSVAQILEKLDLRRPIYQKTASYGHFGRSEFPWEKIVSN
jgi:S-adenosylmethionine synthetase